MPFDTKYKYGINSTYKENKYIYIYIYIIFFFFNDVTNIEIKLSYH